MGTVEESGASQDPGWSGPSGGGGSARGWPFRSAVVVLVVGLLATGGLTVAAALLNSANEHRLIKLRAKEVATALTAVLPQIQTPLASAAALADATKGKPSRFVRLVSPYVGPSANRSFVSLSLWRVSDIAAGPVAVVGVPPVLRPSMGGTAAFFARASTGSGLSVIGLLSGAEPRVGYGFSGPTPGPYVAYGESAVPRSHISAIPPGSPYSDLDFAVYLGRSVSPSDLLVATVAGAQLPGPQAKVSVPFGNSAFTVVISPRHSLGGSLPQRLPWVIALIGALLTLGACALTIQLIRGRRAAQSLAEENRRLYAEQQGIAQVLQHALLPDTLPEISGLEVGARYEAGVDGIDVGGDWYDLIGLSQDQVLLVVGDVSGRGLGAATSMASIRFAVHYAAREDPPAVFLAKLSAMRRLTASRQMATMLCAMINVRTREISLTSAGHLPMLMLSDGRSQFLETKVGLPVGVAPDPKYVSSTFIAPPGATLLAFTDGLVERRGEVLDTGLERLRRAAVDGDETLEELLSRVLVEARGPRSEDDTVIAGIRWLS